MMLMLLTDGVRLSVTARRPCWLGVYWGTSIAELYPVIHRPWLEVRDVAESALMAQISLHSQDLHLFPFCFLLIFGSKTDESESVVVVVGVVRNWFLYSVPGKKGPTGFPE